MADLIGAGGKQQRSANRSYCRLGQGVGQNWGKGLVRPDWGKGLGSVLGASVAGWAGLASSLGEATWTYLGIAGWGIARPERGASDSAEFGGPN